MDAVDARDVALAMLNAEEYEHFGRPAYRIGPNKPGGKPGRTFMTLWVDQGFAVLMLDQALQAELLERDAKAYRPHPSKWGAKGATIAELPLLAHTNFRQAVEQAYDHASR